jgi:heme/copper-type cytochrome/quinol oxidase subunit 2
MPLMDTRRAAALVAVAGVLLFALLVSARSGYVAGESLTAAGQEPTVRSWSVTASRYKFTPSRIEVSQNDLVKIELRSEDIAHSLTIDAYRIAKRVSPGHPITFEFRADQPGTFPFYCNLQIEDGCRQMHGELVVKPRR